MQIKIPFLAEGVESGTVVSILVKEGDQVKKDQTLLELETNKATAPIPSPSTGRITKIQVKEGEEVSVGQTVMTLEEAGVSGEKPETAQPSTHPQVSSARESVSIPVSDEDYTYQSKSGFPPPASPSVRKMALELGIDLTKIRGSERGGRITTKDLKAYLQQLKAQAAPGKGPKGPAPLNIDFSKWGPISKKPISSIRKIIGQKMQESWTTVPHVTQFDEADITSLLGLRKKYVPEYEKWGTRLTVTGIILKAVITLLKKYPIFNASFDQAKGEVIYKAYYHLGVAVDTEQGLLVPVLKDVDRKDLLELSKDVAALSEKARSKKISLEDVQGGTFTISNLGSIGGTYFTPIVNLPEVAILGIGTGVAKPVARAGKVEIRTMLPLSLSYDHRVIDGADGARFIQELVHTLENLSESIFIVKSKQVKVTGKAKK
ncbi:MAG: 2-oxo acid dehydrogenase subunit E2 [Candidatus Omnitrophica bacterium]|nr:2-oxo acid dehydrogenase subunit E2 [Candidatus Omnitrophota bacterium]